MAQNQLFEGTWNRFEPVGDRFKVSLDGLNQQGPYHSEATGKFDGADVPVVATPPRRAAFSYAFRRIDDRTWEIVIEVNGQPQLLVRNVVSEDGKTMRGVSTVVNGGQVNQVAIYEKQ